MLYASFVGTAKLQRRHPITGSKCQTWKVSLVKPVAYLSSSYPKIFIAKSSNTDWEGLNEALDLLEKAARDEDVPTIYKILCAMGIGYNENLPERVAALD